MALIDRNSLLAGVGEHASNHVADSRADTKRNRKRSDKLQCRHGDPGQPQE